MKLSAIFAICLLACTTSMGSVLSNIPYLNQGATLEQQMPQIVPSTCSTPMQIQGQVAVDAIMVEIDEAGRIYEGVGGGCGLIFITDEQLSRLPAMLLADVSAVQDNAECAAKSSSRIDEPYGNRAEVTCVKTIGGIAGEPAFKAYLVIGIIIDADGEVAIYFVTASDSIEEEEEN